jgi:hypothetical protein
LCTIDLHLLFPSREIQRKPKQEFCICFSASSSLSFFIWLFCPYRVLYTLCYCSQLKLCFYFGFMIKKNVKIVFKLSKYNKLKKKLIELSHPALVFSVDRAKCFPRCLTHGDAVHSRTNTPKSSEGTNRLMQVYYGA